MTKQSSEFTIANVFANIPGVWSILSEEEKDTLRQSARILHFKKNEIIYNEEEIPENLMSLVKGKVKIFKKWCWRA